MGLFQVICIGLLAAVTLTQELQECSVDNAFLTVGSTEDAATLATTIQCSNGNFTVQWLGEVFVAETIRVTNGTSLNITAAEPGATADGGDTTQLFVVDGGSLHLSAMTLAHGYASSDGGAIHAESSHVSLSGNTSLISNYAIDDGGAIYASRSMVTWDGYGTEFRENYAGDDGGAIYAGDSTVFWNADRAEFKNNSARGHGGAIYSDDSVVFWDGDAAKFSNNVAGTSGGAIYMYYSIVSWDGDDAEFSYNSAASSGGAIYARYSSVSWDGNGTEFSTNNGGSSGGAIYAEISNMFCGGDGHEFSNNTANFDGGAIGLHNSNVSWAGDGTEFSNNNARYTGGAIHAEISNMFWDGDGVEFSNNHAGQSGGAFYMSASNVAWDGDGAEFSNNSADIGGGAIYAASSSVSWVGNGTEFSTNNVGIDGGAIQLSNSNLFWDGDGIEFDNNYAGNNGGAIRLDSSNLSWDGDGTEFSTNNADAGSGGAVHAAYSSSVSWNGPTSFKGNVAGDDGGAVALFDFGYENAHFSDATFIENSAQNGGALYVYSSAKGFDFADLKFQSNAASDAGGALAMHAGADDFPATFSRCDFSDNTANGAGGAVETLSGQQGFISCTFEGNSADVGGAMSLGGETDILDCSFLSNSASSRGLAIAVVGSANVSGSAFDGNEFYCGVDSFREDTEQDDDTKRFDTVCLDCPPLDECSGCTITRANVTPECVAPLAHTTAEEPGVTVETLNITRGYWRATNKSEQILACHNADACGGGQTGAESFCAPGYKGPYCAVCETDYAPSLGRTCRQCSSSRRQGLMAATIVAALASAFAIATITKFLLSTKIQERNVRCFHRRVLRALPVQALKIIVVVWQILTQFADVASVTYPGVYQDFLSLIDIVNFDVGSMLAVGCLWSGMDFHDRLLVSTLGPLVVAGFLALTYRIALRRNGSDGNTAVVKKIRHKHQTALLLLTFLVYSSVSSTVFQTFACETLDDKIEYLRADYRIHCTDGKHKAFQVYAGIMIAAYPVGIPLLYAVLLFQRRDVLSDAGADKTAAQPISSLWEPYTPEKFYYEVVECGRRIMLTGVVVFIFPNDAAQIAITMLVAFFFFAVFELLSPYKSEADTWLSRGGHVIVYLSMFDVLLLKVDVSSESDQSQAIFAGVLVAGHVMMALAIVVEVVGICYASRKKRVVDEVVTTQSLPESRPRAAPDADVPVFQSAPASWRPFMRQGSVSEMPGPARSVSCSVATVCKA